MNEVVVFQYSAFSAYKFVFCTLSKLVSSLFIKKNHLILPQHVNLESLHVQA